MIRSVGDRVALVRHRRRALLALAERLLDLADLGALQVADLGREPLQPGAGQRDLGEQLGMPVAGDDLGRGVLDREAEPLHHRGLDGRGQRGVGTDGAGELAVGGAGERPAQALDVPVRLEGEAGEAQPEARRLGVDPVRAADADRVPLLERPIDERVAVGDRAGDEDLPGGADLRRQRGVENVGGRQPVVDPPALRTDRGGDDVDERGDVVVGRPLALLDRLDGEPGSLPACPGVLGGHHPRLGEGLGHRQLDLEPALHLALLRPDRADLLACVAGDQRPMIRAA